MCNIYCPASADQMRLQWQVLPPPGRPTAGPIGPKQMAPFIRAASDGSKQRECVFGQWQLVPSDWVTLAYPYSTNNARWEDKVRTSKTFKPPWLKGQRCIIPAAWFREPCWETGKHIPWTFERADDKALALAGLWNRWNNAQTGGSVETFTMITMNADAHPLMKRMHKPEPKLSSDQQDKRMVVVLADEDQDTWLFGSNEEAETVVKHWPVDEIRTTFEAPAQSSLF